MVIQYSQRTTHNGREGRMYTVSAKVKVGSLVGPTNGEKVAKNKAKFWVALSERDLEPQRLEAVEVRETQTEYFSINREFEVKVFRPYD